MKFLKIAGRLTLGFVTIAVLLYLVADAINWRDEPPSAAARDLDDDAAGPKEHPQSREEYFY